MFSKNIYYNREKSSIKKDQKINFAFMKSSRILFCQLIIVSALTLNSGQIIAQQQAIDTSEYMPSFYPGAYDINLMIAASKGYTLEIERLIEKGANVNAETDEGATALIFAVSNNKLLAVKTLIYYNPDLDKRTSNYETPLIISVKNRNFEIAETLIRAGANLDYTDSHGATPLHHATVSGYMEIVDLLLYYGALIDAKTEEGSTPLLASIRAGYQDISDLLIQNGANMEARDNDGFTPFILAAYFGDTIILDLLSRKGVDIYATNKYNHNALTISIVNGQTSTTKFLLKSGNNWVQPAGKTLNPYNVATKYQRKEVIDILKASGVPGQAKHAIDQVALTVSSRFCLHDAYPGISLSFKEPYLNGGFLVGFDMKLRYTRVLVQSSENLFYQYMDKGSVAYAGIFKDFTITDRQNKANLAISTSIMAGYSFGNKLKGTLISHGKRLTAVPSISLKMTKLNFSINMGIEYLKTDYYKNGPVWLRIGCSYNHYFDKIRTKVKPVKWY